MDKIARVDL